MAARASAEVGWSTSSSKVLSDWTINGPSVTFSPEFRRLSIVANAGDNDALPSSGLHQALPPRPGHQPGPAVDVEFGQHVVQMGLHGGLADHQTAGDLAVRESLGDQPHDVDL